MRPEQYVLRSKVVRREKLSASVVSFMTHPACTSSREMEGMYLAVTRGDLD
jgi:hypothetical protein